VIGIFYGLFAFVAVTNLLLMRRPKAPKGERASVAVLIPARNEAENLKGLLPSLVGKAKVYVYDDESDDGTGDVAAALGATAIRAREVLPEGWTGKNRACHELALAASEDSDARWLLFLDADVRVTPDFFEGLQSLIEGPGKRCGVITGFPRIVPGRGIEPLFLAWVGWILLASSPYGLTGRSKVGHCRFTNGQFHLWRSDVYTSLWPNQQVRRHVLEDVAMGRLLAKENIAVEVANVSSILSVKMYDTWRETLDGMSKNAFEIAGSAVGSYGIAALLFAIGWLWLLAPWTYGLLVLSGLAAAATVRCRWFTFPVILLVMPTALTIGGYTVLRSVSWRKKGTVTWKGRTYPS